MGSESGSNSNLESNNNYYGKWTDDKCECKDGDKYVFDDDKVTDIYWRSTYLVRDSIRNLSTAGRIITLGISEIWCKGNSLTHDYVEARVECSKCGMEKWVTFEYGCSGKSWRVGYYSKCYSKNGSINSCSRSFKSILDKYNSLKGFTDKDYRFTSNNCKTFAEKFFDIL